jgi:predicted lipase
MSIESFHFDPPTNHHPRFERSSGFSLSNAYHLSILANEAYKKRDQIKQKTKELDPNSHFIFYDNPKTHTQAFLFETDEDVVVSFRGTIPTNMKDILKDVDVRRRKMSIGNEGSGYSHQGFTKAVDSVFSKPFENRQGDIQNSIMDDLRSILERHPNKKIWFTGHSLGAALATVASAKFNDQIDDPKEKIGGIYAFASPRAFSPRLANAFDTALKDRTYRIVNKNDIVTKMPDKIADWQHVGNEVYISHGNKLVESPSYLGKRLDQLCARAQSYIQEGNIVPGLTDHDMPYYCEVLRDNYSHTQKNIRPLDDERNQPISGT